MSMSRVLKDLVAILFATLLITFAVWLPYFLKLENFYGLNFSAGFATIYRNFDGLEYVIIAKTFYQPNSIADQAQSLPAIYYASHFPGYALLILLFAPILGFLKSMLFVSSLFTILAAGAFYFLLKDFKLTSHPLSLSLIFLVLPARWLIVHSVGSSEPIFIFFIILALYFFLRYEQAKRWSDIYLVGLFGLFAQLTRPPGILLFIALSLYILWKIIGGEGRTLVARLIQAVVHYYPLILIPLGLVGIFYWFNLAYQDFFAYFHSGDNIHLTFPPFQVFNINQFWVGDIWLEDVIYIFLVGFTAGLILLKQRLFPMGFFVLTYMIASIFVVHRDISRYVLPIIPFVLIAFEKVLTSKEFKIVLIILMLGIYLYAQNFILANIGPYPNLEVFN